MSLFSISLNFFWRVEFCSASCMYSIAFAIPPLSFPSNGFLYHFSTFWINQKMSKHEEGKVQDNLWEEQHKFIDEGKYRNQIYRSSFIHVGRTGFFVKLSFARVTPLTSWVVIFFVLSPNVQHSIKARWNVCQFLWVFLAERRWAVIIFSLDRSTITEARRCSFWCVHCSPQSWRERAYNAITSVFGIPSFTSVEAWREKANTTL